MRTRALVLTAAGLLCASMPAGADDDPFLDGGQITRAFAVELGRLHAAGKTTPMSVLTNQLAAARGTSLRVRSGTGRVYDSAELYDRCRDGVVFIGSIYKCRRCAQWHASGASGFVLASDGLVATDYHVIEDEEGRCATIGIRLWDGRILPVREVVAADRTNDLAVVRVEAADLRALPLAAAAEVGEPVVVISHTDGVPWALAEGTVSAKSIRRQKRSRVPKLLVTADFAQGSSGGPVLNRRGEVVGLVESTTTVVYDDDEHDPGKVQMVWKAITPATLLRDLVSRPEAGETRR
jgi:S1-C subfamily serine protease